MQHEPLNEHLRQRAINQSCSIERTCLERKIKLSKYTVKVTISIEIGVSITGNSIAELIAFNQSLARAVHGLKLDREPTSRNNLIFAFAKSLTDVYETLEEIGTAQYLVDGTCQTDSDIRHYWILLFRSNLANGLFECLILSEMDRISLNRFIHDRNQIICNQLGLDEEIIDLLPNTEIRTHKSFIDWVKLIMKNRYEDLKDHRNTMAVLNELGFTKLAAAMLALWIGSSESMSHKDILYWVLYYLDFCYNDIIAKETIALKETRVHVDETRPIIYDLFVKGHSEEFLKAMLPQINPDENFWYHGTILKHEQNIANNGIDLSHANAGDFSENGCGFYLTSSFRHAADYAEAKAMCDNDKRFAVLVFQVQNNFLESYEGIDLSGEEDLWRNVIKYYNDYQANGRLKEPAEVRDLQYIEGPTSKCFDRGRECGTFHQLCIRDDEMAELFGKKLCRILYFQSS